MGTKVGLAAWFMPTYVSFFVFVAILALVVLVAVVRRPVGSFPGSWPRPKVRWGLVPATVLVVIGLQLVPIGLALLPDKALFVATRTWLAPAATTIGFATVVLTLAMLVEGVAYLLRIVFPAGRRVADVETPLIDPGAAPDRP